MCPWEFFSPRGYQLYHCTGTGLKMSLPQYVSTKHKPMHTSWDVLCISMPKQCTPQEVSAKCGTMVRTYHFNASAPYDFGVYLHPHKGERKYQIETAFAFRIWTSVYHCRQRPRGAIKHRITCNHPYVSTGQFYSNNSSDIRPCLRNYILK